MKAKSLKSGQALRAHFHTGPVTIYECKKFIILLSTSKES